LLWGIWFSQLRWGKFAELRARGQEVTGNLMGVQKSLNIRKSIRLGSRVSRNKNELGKFDKMKNFGLGAVISVL
jgi:hypothetical protein